MWTICKKGEIYDLDLKKCISIYPEGEKYYEESDLCKLFNEEMNYKCKEGEYFDENKNEC